MIDLGQARDRIWESVTARGGAAKVAEAAGLAGPSMLYKFRLPPERGGKLLGKDTVAALAPVLTEIEPEVWLAAMGVPVTERPATEALA